MEIYEYKGHRYYLLEYGKMKVSEHWIRCVIYRDENTLDVYVREFEDFILKFKKVEKQF